MRKTTIKQFRYFEALAQAAHFGRAADICAISQPALSVQIKELETTLGIALFERGPRQVRLTAFGEEFATRARDILRAVDELGDLARAARAGLGGRLRIGIIPTVAPYLLPKLIADLSCRHPDLDLHIRETVTPKLIEELQTGKIDTAILALPINEPSLKETPLFTEDLVLIRQQKDADLPTPDQDALRDMRLLLLEEGHCFRDQALSFCNLGGSRQREGLDGTSLSTLVQMVGAGIGVTLIPDMAVEVETKSAPVSVARFDEPRPTRTVGIVWRKSNPLGDQLTQLAQVVLDVASAQD